MASNGDSVSKLGHLQEQLEGFIENLRTVGVIAGDFQQSGQNVLNERLNRVVQNMRDLDRVKDAYEDVQIPYAVLGYIDRGQNPDLFTRHQLEQSLADHQAVQQKVQAYKDFRQQLVRQLEQYFPEEIHAYVENSKH